MTGLDYERFRNYSPSLGTWISQDPLCYVNGANTYQFVGSGPVGNVDPTGLQVYIGPGSGWPQGTGGSASGVGAYTQELQWQYIQWWQEGSHLSSEMVWAFLSQQFARTSDNAGLAFEKFAGELKSDPPYRAAAQTNFRQMAIKYGKPGIFLLWPKIPPKGEFFPLSLKSANAQYASNYFFGTPLPQFAGSLGEAHIGYLGGVMIIKGCPGHLHWKVYAEMMEGNWHHWTSDWLDDLEPVYRAGYVLQSRFGFKPYYHQMFWHDSFHGSLK